LTKKQKIAAKLPQNCRKIAAKLPQNCRKIAANCRKIVA
jgi:hypothetical protein